MGAFYQRQALGVAQLPRPRAVDTSAQVLGHCEIMAMDEHAVHLAWVVLVAHTDGVVGDRLASGLAGVRLVLAAKAKATPKAEACCGARAGC
jgi:hypothetical protein